MNRDIAEADHAAHPLCQLGSDLPGRRQQVECLGAALRDTKVFLGYDMHSEIYRRLAGSFEIEDDCILMGEIVSRAGSPAYSSAILRRQRSMIAALFKSTSSIEAFRICFLDRRPVFA